MSFTARNNLRQHSFLKPVESRVDRMAKEVDYLPDKYKAQVQTLVLQNKQTNYSIW
jgi:hypothetical protein